MFTFRFTSRIASFVKFKDCDPRVVRASLSILESLVLNASGGYTQVDSDITLNDLVLHLQVLLIFFLNSKNNDYDN